MNDKSKVIFDNQIDKKTIMKGYKSQKKYLKKFGDDRGGVYHLSAEPIPSLDFIHADNLVLSDKPMKFDDKAIIIGNIRMGFGHYRISIAMASCAYALGYKPYWFDLASFDATGSKMIRAQNDLYSLGSKISQKSHIFNHFIWEPMNSEGFRKLTYNSIDQRNSELLAPLYQDFPKDVPFIATHAWPSQGAVHVDMSHVVDAIPDNWPMALHLSEGAIHVVQTPFAYLGYKTLNGMAKTQLDKMPDDSLYEVGHYVDHELVSNVEKDTANRIKRIEKGEPIRILLTVGGAGAGSKQFLALMKDLLPLVKLKKVAIFLNFGDHYDMNEFLKKKLPGFEEGAKTFFDRYEEFRKFVSTMDDEVLSGIYLFYNKNIFEAVYSTNLLMRHVDLLITKPSELAYYPIPKVFMRHIGGHEVYGAVHGQEYGDATYECDDELKMRRILHSLVEDKSLLIHLCEEVEKLKKNGVYDGGYEAVKMAVKGK